MTSSAKPRKNKLQVATATAHRTGSPGGTASIIEIAEAAEQEWLRREDVLALEGWPQQQG